MACAMRNGKAAEGFLDCGTRRGLKPALILLAFVSELKPPTPSMMGMSAEARRVRFVKA